MTKDEALRLALDALTGPGYYDTYQQRQAIAAIKQVMEQPEPEPVAWEGGEGWESLAWELCAEEHGEDACSDLIWESGPIPEPWGDRWMKYESEAKRLIALVHKHTSPPKREPEPVQWGVDWGMAGDVPCVSIIKRLPDGGIEVVAVEYGPKREPLTDRRWAMFCGICRKEWSVPYQHPGKSVCDQCVSDYGIKGDAP